MHSDPKKVLSENLRRIIGEQSQAAWAAAHGLDKKPVQRAVRGEHAATLDTLAALAIAAGLQPWQLLVPGLDHRNPPVHPMTQTERDLYQRLRTDLERLPPIIGSR